MNKLIPIVASLAAAFALTLPAGASAQVIAAAAAAKAVTSQKKAAKQRTFATPEDAVKALVDAVRAGRRERPRRDRRPRHRAAGSSPATT